MCGRSPSGPGICRTPALGGRVTQCDHSGEVRYHYHSSGNRNCPQCGGSKRAAWLAGCRPTSCPFPTSTSSSPCRAAGRPWYWATVSLLYRLLFAKQGVSSGGGGRPKHLGAQIGVLMVLHTWGQKPEHHPYPFTVSCPAAAGDPRQVLGKHRDCPRRPGTALGVLPAQLVLVGPGAGRGLPRQVPGGRARPTKPANSSSLGAPCPWRARRLGRLDRALYQKDWVVYAKEPFGGPEQVLKYLTGYTHRVALSNHRLVKLEDGHVTFLLEGLCRRLRRKEMTLDADDHRTGCTHIVPKGLVRIRRYGLLAHRDRGQRLALCRSLLAAGAGPAPEPESPPPSASGGSTDSDQSPSGAGPAPSLVEPESAAPSRMGISILVVLVSLLVASQGTRPRSPHPRLCRQPRVWSTIAVPGCGVGHLPANDLASRPTRTGRTPTHSHSGQFVPRIQPEPHLPVPSPPAPAGTGPSLTAQGVGSDWSTAGYRHDRINPGDPHLGQSFFDYMSGRRLSFLPSA